MRLPTTALLALLTFSVTTIAMDEHYNVFARDAEPDMNIMERDPVPEILIRNAEVELVERAAPLKFDEREARAEWYNKRVDIHFISSSTYPFPHIIPYYLLYHAPPYSVLT
ncbi:hypothetical protein MMC17_004805 [Xylographa soralifera]|nr:hypothetical protein [Xylographa soralifera]